MIKSFTKIKNAFTPEISISDLSSILEDMNPSNHMDKRITALRDLMMWIRLPVKVTSTTLQNSHIHSRNVRFKFLLQFMQHNSTKEKFFAETMRELITQGNAVSLFYLSGVSDNSGFISELADRITAKFLPLAFGDRDLAEFFRIIFTQEGDAEWFDMSYKAIVPPLRELLIRYEISTQNLMIEINEAMVVLGCQISAMGISKEIRRRIGNQKVSNMPFVQLSKVIITVSETDETVLKKVVECQQNLDLVRKKIEMTGVSVDLIYNLERILSMLQRIRILVYLRRDSETETKDIIVAHFIASLIRDESKRLGIKNFLHEHLIMLTKKIVERAGEKGDPYIANTKEDRHHLFVAASFAGVLTAFTSIIKVLIGLVGFPLMFEGIFYFINYAIGFLLMQRWHLALSSKQPAFTASALSRKFEEFLKTKELTNLTGEVRKIARSQWIATIGNLLWVIPVVMLLDWGCFYITGEHFLSQKEAHRMLKKHSLFQSGTIFYAAFTGFLLWLSSVVAGWVENWIVFRSIPEALKDSTVMVNFLGKEKATIFGNKFASVLGAASGNISIALFMAFPVIIGKFTGIPLDIRHVTLATGTITLSLNAIPWDLTILPLLFSLTASIAVMGLLNFGVSFYLAIRMAAMARGVSPKYLKVIFKFALRK